jgi:hypothetical protein
VKPGSRSARAAFVLSPILAVVALFACGTDPSVSAAGEECFEATDCQDGLICVPQQNGSRVCSNDLSGVSGKPPGEDAGPMEAGEGGELNDGAPPTDAPAQDTSAPDTSVKDTGSPPADAADEGD